MAFWSLEVRPEVRSFSDLVHNEKCRYLQKGPLLSGAFLLLYLFFFVLPPLLQPYYLNLPHNNPYIMHLVIPYLINISALILSNVLYSILYFNPHKYLEAYRLPPGPWPWEKDPIGFKTLLLSSLKMAFFNNFIFVPCLLYVNLFINHSPHNTNPDDFPSSFELLKHFIYFMILDDIAFYWCHRLFHTPFLYKNFHKKHHEYKDSIGLAATYSHPFDFFFTGAVPAMIGGAVLGHNCHIFTFYLWSIWRTSEGTDGHSGYEFPWSPFRVLPFSAGASFHEFHHTKNIGNYSSFFTIWDAICRTSPYYFKHLLKVKKF